MAAATCSDGEKPTMGCSLPSSGHSEVRTIVISWPPSRAFGPAAAARQTADVSPVCLPRGSDWHGRWVGGGVAVRPVVVGLACRAPADRVDQPDAARHLVP